MLFLDFKKSNEIVNIDPAIDFVEYSSIIYNFWNQWDIHFWAAHVNDMTELKINNFLQSKYSNTIAAVGCLGQIENIWPDSENKMKLHIP